MKEDVMFEKETTEFQRWNEKNPSAAGLLCRNADRTVRILYLNPAMKETLGLTEDPSAEEIFALLGNKDKIVSAFDQDLPVEWEKHSFSGRIVMSCRCTRESGNLAVLWVSSSHEQRAEELLEKILATTKTAIFWKDADRRFLGANKAFLDYYGFPSAEVLLGKNDEEMGWHTDPDPYKNDELQIIRKGISTTRVPGMCLSHGENRNIVASKAPMYENGRIVGLVGSFEDVTNDVRQKKEIEELNRKLDAALKAERKASQAKTDFLARMSHDMRTPLTTVMGLCDIAFEHYQDEEILSYFRNIKSSSHYLLSILTDILDMEKLASGKITLNPVICTKAETEHILGMMIRPAADAKHINLLIDIQCTDSKCYPKVDVRRVQQILLNLLSNAVKYTPEGGSVSCISRMEEIGGKAVCTHVISDNGKGIDPEFQKVMYDPFSRETEGVFETGSGLGLAIVKKLVDLMNGTIACSSQPGKGTVFTVTIPHEMATEKEIEQYRAAAERPEIRKSFRKYRILICEDNDINARIIMRLLQGKDFETERAENGKIGTEMAGKNHYDAILMDIRMPVMDGCEAAREIRKFDASVPIIALSANDFAEDIDKSIASGMNAHLAKPIDTEQLFSTLANLIEGRKDCTEDEA
jgi:PAS domain S-box-containing protein